MSVYYLKGQSNYGDSAGLTGYYYPLYTDASLINGKYHTHTFVGLDDVVFYMPSSEMNHGTENAPSVSSYGRTAYQEYATYNLNDEGQIYYTNITASTVQQVVSVASYSPRKLTPARNRVTNNESTRVEDLIPIQLRESSETLIELLSDYYRYLNESNQASNIVNRIVSEQDIDSTSLDYLDRLQKEIAKTVPASRTLDKVSLYKRIVKYYSIRGSEESVIVFFRIFFDELVEIFYPKDFLLKPSEGKWISDDNITYYTDYFSGRIPIDQKFNEQNINDIVSLRNDNDDQITTGRITRIEKQTSDNANHPVKNDHVIEIDARDSSRYNVDNPDEPIFKPFNHLTNSDAQANAILKNGVAYSPLTGFDFSRNPGGSNRSGNHINVGQIYNSENITEVTDEFTMVARVKNNRYEHGTSLGQIFTTSWSYPSHSLSFMSGKLGARFFKWGSYHGFNQVTPRGSTAVPINEWSTIAVRGKRDPNATSSAGGTGYVEVSVNAETWERIWDDSDYGTPTSFNLNNVVSRGGNLPFNYNITNFTESGTHNGKPMYVSTTSENSGTSSYHVMNLAEGSPNGGGYKIKFYPSMGNGTDGFGFGTSSWNENREDVYGYWVLEAHFASIKYALVIWPDIGPNANMYETTKDLLRTTDTNIRSQFPYSLSTTTNVGNGAYGSNLNDRGPNDSGAARTNFFDVIKDFNRQLSPGVNENGSRIQNKRYPIHYAQYGGLGSSFVASTGTEEVSFESNDKKLTWATTKDLLDVKDKNGPLRLGIGRYTLYYTGNLLHFSYFNKLVSQDDLSKIHTYYSLFYKNTWGLRISLNEDVSLTNTKSITDLSNTVYKLSNLSGHEINSFWSYDANKIGSVSLSNFVLIGTNGTINFGDGSIPKEYFNNRILSHGFAASNSLQGSYNNRKGFLSDNNKLQDSNFWQNYSYQIKTNLSSSEWINQYLRLVHPAGMKLFAAFLLQIVRKNNWTGDKDYSANNAQEKNQLEKWLKKLIPPWRRDDVDEFGYHMPFYQPGWLSSDARLLSLLLEGLVFAGQNARSGGNLFVRTVLMVLKFISGENRFNRNDIVFRQHLKDQKFFDSHTRSADYAYLTGNELGIQRRGVIPSQSSEPNFLSTFLPWSVGSGHDNVYGTTSSLRWEAAGSTAENVREYRKDPFGKSSIVWVAKDLDSAVDYEGGFYSPMVNIDASLNVVYRFSVWMKQQNRTGDKYFGLFARDTGGDETTDSGIQRADTNVTSQTPHFLREFDLPRNNEWFLLVGYLRPLDSTGETPNQTILTDTSGGVYDTSGNRVLQEDFRTSYSPVEWKYTSVVNGLRLRAFNYNNNSNTGSEVEIWGPRIEIVGPASPDIPELIFPTIDSNIMYGKQNRPLDKFVYKLNNFSTKIEGEAQPFIVNSVTTNDINYYNQVNYNENLKFLDNTKIGSYYSVKISDMTNTQESGLVVQSDDGYITPAAGDNLSQNEYSSYTISNPPSSAY